jgi:hypothetical protein
MKPIRITKEALMKRARRLPTLRAALTVAIIILILVLAPGVGAVSTFKTLYTFTGGADGSQPYAGLIFDQSGIPSLEDHSDALSHCDLQGGGSRAPLDEFRRLF